MVRTEFLSSVNATSGIYIDGGDWSGVFEFLFKSTSNHSKLAYNKKNIRINLCHNIPIEDRHWQNRKEGAKIIFVHALRRFRMLKADFAVCTG